MTSKNPFHYINYKEDTAKNQPVSYGQYQARFRDF